MKKYLEVEENTEFYEGSVEVTESHFNPGMALIQVCMKDKTTNERESAGIRLTLDQARQVGAHLLELANKLGHDQTRRKNKHGKKE